MSSGGVKRKQEEDYPSTSAAHELLLLHMASQRDLRQEHSSSESQPSPEPQSFEIRGPVGKRRCREGKKKNYTDQETELLVNEVMANRQILFAAKNDKKPMTVRNAIWNEIMLKVNTVGIDKRTVRELKKKWVDLRNKVKGKMAIIAKEAQQTRGPRLNLKLSAMEAKVASIYTRKQIQGIGTVDVCQLALQPSPQPEATLYMEVSDELELSPTNEDANTAQPNETLYMEVSDEVEFSPTNEDVNTTQPEASTYLPNVSTLLPNVSTLLPNVSTLLPNVSTHLPNISTHLPTVSTHLPNVSTHLPNVSTHLPNISTHLPNISKNLPNVTVAEKVTPVESDQQFPCDMGLRTAFLSNYRQQHLEFMSVVSARLAGMERCLEIIGNALVAGLSNFGHTQMPTAARLRRTQPPVVTHIGTHQSVVSSTSGRSDPSISDHLRTASSPLLLPSLNTSLVNPYILENFCGTLTTTPSLGPQSPEPYPLDLSLKLYSGTGQESNTLQQTPDPENEGK